MIYIPSIYDAYAQFQIFNCNISFYYELIVLGFKDKNTQPAFNVFDTLNVSWVYATYYVTTPPNN